MGRFRITRQETGLYGLLVLLLVALFWNRLWWMAHLWWSDGLYSLSALVPLVSLGLVYVKRNKLKVLPVSPSRAGIPVLVAGAAFTLTADWLNILYSFTPLLIVLILGGVILALWGTAVFKELFFPLAFLLLLVPIPPPVLERIDLPLQILCAKAVQAGSHLAGMGTQRAGSIILFPGSGNINVAPACNGLRSALTMLMLAIIYAHLSPARWYSKAAVIAAAFPLAYLANLVRLFGIVSAAHFLGAPFMDHEQAFDHVFGLIVFSGCVVLFLLWARMVKCRSFMATC